ncbi:uncharacterized protein BDR25DRAFT_353849 [Lindgomyces ingoldianus]|uniref:Uncharacterized protein n=1 Tax=Lindgomyces ingoldianus TaxID=673940 RepID=A0ACB6QYL8_9PLEO|nr:uncharacterized protein BDR25DRAFT_353849 [Lindgomyces ingoldianus]KAF2472113.1 hypothetical protein BDR25DRAFT_353849 [Lindgomyces ingoldianus]
MFTIFFIFVSFINVACKFIRMADYTAPLKLFAPAPDNLISEVEVGWGIGFVQPTLCLPFHSLLTFTLPFSYYLIIRNSPSHHWDAREPNTGARAVHKIRKSWLRSSSQVQNSQAKPCMPNRVISSIRKFLFSPNGDWSQPFEDLEGNQLSSQFSLNTHAPDRITPKGHFSFLGGANSGANMLEEWITTLEEHGYITPAIFLSEQSLGKYNPLSRAHETEIFPVVRKNRMKLVTYSPPAGGFLTGLRIFSPPSGIVGTRFEHTEKNLKHAHYIARSTTRPQSIPPLRYYTHVQPYGIEILSIPIRTIEKLEKYLKAYSTGPLPEPLMEVIGKLQNIVEKDAKIATKKWPVKCQIRRNAKQDHSDTNGKHGLKNILSTSSHSTVLTASLPYGHEYYGFFHMCCKRTKEQRPLSITLGLTNDISYTRAPSCYSHPLTIHNPRPLIESVNEFGVWILYYRTFGGKIISSSICLHMGVSDMLTDIIR